MPDYVTDGTIGVDLTATYASASAYSMTPLPFAPGTIVHTSNNGKYIFARAQSTIVAFDACILSVYGDSASSTPIPRAVPVETTNVGALGYNALVIPQVSITSAYYGWMAMSGTGLRVKTLIACQPNVTLYATATAGSLDDTTVSLAVARGVVLCTSATSASAPQCFVNNASYGIIGGS